MTEDERANGADLPADVVAVCGEPTGTVNAEATLFEEEGQYGPIFILQLADFLRALGTRSPHTLSCMQVVCETAFHKYLGPKGTYSLHGGAFFIFRFGRLEAVEARRLAHQAIDEIGRHLLGDYFIPFAATGDINEPNGATKASAPTSATESDWKALSNVPGGTPDGDGAEGTDGEGKPIARRRREAQAHARDVPGKGGGTTGERGGSRIKRGAAI